MLAKHNGFDNDYKPVVRVFFFRCNVGMATICVTSFQFGTMSLCASRDLERTDGAIQDYSRTQHIGWAVPSAPPPPPPPDHNEQPSWWSVHSPRTRSSMLRCDVKLCLLRATHVYVASSVGFCTLSMCSVPFSTRCHMLVGSRTPSATRRVCCSVRFYAFNSTFCTDLNQIMFMFDPPHTHPSPRRPRRSDTRPPGT